MSNGNVHAAPVARVAVPVPHYAHAQPLPAAPLHHPHHPPPPAYYPPFSYQAHAHPDARPTMNGTAAGRPHTVPVPHFAPQPYYAASPTRAPYQPPPPPPPPQPAWQPTMQAPPVPAHEMQQVSSFPPPPPNVATAGWGDSAAGRPPPFPMRAHPVQQQQDSNFVHPHNMASHPYSQSYSARPPHLPVEPNAAPSPPTQYPASPRTPLSAGHVLPAPPRQQQQQQQQQQQHHHQQQQQRPLACPADHGPERASFAEPHPSPSMPSPLARHTSSAGLRTNSVVAPLGPPTPVTSGFATRGYARDSFGDDERQANARRRDDADVKAEPQSPTASPHAHAAHVKAETDSPVRRDHGVHSPSKPEHDPPPKKKGVPVFRDRNGREYYENDPVPPEAEPQIPATYQIGNGKHTKGLLLPKVKDGITVNPEWGFTAGGKARQRLPQACKNCRAKKIRCMESDYDESICQHCMKMQIPCQREDEKKSKKSRTNSTHERPRNSKPERGSSTSSIAYSVNGQDSNNKKRKSADESADPSHRKMVRRESSRTASMSHEPAPIDTVRANNHNQPYRTNSAMFATSPYTGHQMDDESTSPGVSRDVMVKQLRSQQQFDGARINGTPLSTFSSASPATSSVSMPPAVSFHVIDQRYGSRGASVSTPATMGTPAIPRGLGEDPRHMDLPNRATLEHLTQIYFCNVYSQTYAFLHRETFEEDLDKHPPVLLFSMCAVAARFSDRIESGAEEMFAERTRELIKENYFNYSLELVQSMVHMGLHDFGSNNGNKAWMFAGMAVRMGAAMNLNLEKGRRGDSDKSERSNVAREVARRTYWSYYLMDRFNSYGVARPYLTQDHDCHIQLPCNQPSFTRCEYRVTEHLLGPNPYFPKVGTQYMGAMAYLVRIVGIWGNILRQIHLSGFQTASTGRGRHKEGKEFEEFISKLEHWRKTLPAGLEYSNENLAGQIEVGTTGAFVLMHVMWHTAMAYVHRYVRTVGIIVKDALKSEEISKTFVVESIRKAFVHADAVLQIMCHVRKRQEEALSKNQEPVIVNAPFLGQAISDACNITVIRALEIRGEPGGAREQKSRVYIGLDWLRELKKYWKPLEGIFRKLRRTCKRLDKTMSQPPLSRRTHNVPTPDSSTGVVDNGLQPGNQYAVDPNQFSAQQPTPQESTMLMEAFAINTEFPYFQDYLAPGVVPYDMYTEAFNSDWANHGLAEIAGGESGFPELYQESTLDQMPPTLGPPIAGAYEAGYQVVPTQTAATSQTSSGTFLPPSEGAADDDDDDDEGETGASETEGPENAGRDINTIYFDSAAVRDGTFPETAQDDIDVLVRKNSDTQSNSRAKIDIMSLLYTTTDEVRDKIANNPPTMNESTYRGGDGWQAAPGDTSPKGPIGRDNSQPPLTGGDGGGGSVLKGRGGHHQ